jgi:hypothetical protein
LEIEINIIFERYNPMALLRASNRFEIEVESTINFYLMLLPDSKIGQLVGNEGVL